MDGTKSYKSDSVCECVGGSVLLKICISIYYSCLKLSSQIRRLWGTAGKSGSRNLRLKNTIVKTSWTILVLNHLKFILIAKKRKYEPLNSFILPFFRRQFESRAKILLQHGRIAIFIPRVLWAYSIIWWRIDKDSGSPPLEEGYNSLPRCLSAPKIRSTLCASLAIIQGPSQRQIER